MKSFIRFLKEDIVGGIPGPESYDTTVHKSSRKKKRIGDLDSLVKSIGVNYVPSETTKIVPIDDNFHATIDHHESDNGYNYMKVRVMSSKPGHENVSLMQHVLTSSGRDFFTTESGKKIRVFQGTPQKTRLTEVRRGVFKLPKNYLHTVANATGFGIISGGTQSPGAISMWRKAVHHGHKRGNPVHRVLQVGSKETYPGEHRTAYAGDISYKSYGKMTPRNFADAYTGDVSRKKTGNKSRVPSGTIKDTMKNAERIEDQRKMGNRAESHLLVIPHEG